MAKRPARRIGTSLVAIIAAASFGGCQSDRPDHQTALDPSAVRTEIDRLRSEYESAVASGDANAIGSLLAEGAVMVRPGGPDWDAMAAAAGGAPFPPGAKIKITPIEVVALSNEWAYEFGTSTTNYKRGDPAEVAELRDTYLILFRNTGKGWQAYREVASSAPPPSGWPED